MLLLLFLNKTTIKQEPAYVAVVVIAQVGERRSAEREVTGSNPGRTNTQGL